MPDTAAVQLRRILQLFPEFGDGEPHKISEIVASVGVDRDALLRDLRAVSEHYDVPGGFIEALQIYLGPDTVSLSSSHFQRPMALTRAELGALELGLAMLRRERPAEEHRAIDRARDRLRKAISTTPASDEEQRRYASLSSAGDPVHLGLLRRARRTHHRVRLRYRKAGTEEATDRVLCPYEIVFANGMWYVVANCGDEGLRIFRLDRVEEVEVLDQRYERPEDFSLDDVLRDGRAFQSASAGVLRVRYSPRIARWIAEREGQAVDGDGSVTIDHPLADTEWAVRHVLQYGPDAEVLEPEEVRAEIVRRLERIVV